MRIVAIIANLILLGLSILLFFSAFVDALEWGGLDTEFLPFYSVIFATSIINIVALIRSRKSMMYFLKLWFERKSLEEKKKIKELELQS